MKISDDNVKAYDIQDIFDAECTLEPLKCRKCGSLEVVFLKGVMDAYCENCGRWQLAISRKKEKNNDFVL